MDSFSYSQLHTSLSFKKRLPEVPGYVVSLNSMITSFQRDNDVTCLPMCGYVIFIFPMGWYRVCKNFLIWVKNSRNHDLVYENRTEI